MFNYVRITQSVVTNWTRAVQEGNLLQVYPNQCHGDEKLFSTMTEVITKTVCLEDIFVGRKRQSDVSPARMRLFERLTSSCKPELVDKCMRLVSRALEKELGKKTSSEEAVKIRRKIILQEVPIIADAEKEGILARKRQDFIQGFCDWLLQVNKLESDIPPAFALLNILIELLEYKFYGSFRYILTDSFRVEFIGSMTAFGTSSQIRSGLSSQVS